MLSWIFAGVMLMVIAFSAASALVIAAPWNWIDQFFEAMFGFWGDVLSI